MAITAPFAPSAPSEFDIGQTERKMDMTLDDIIKMSKKAKNRRVPIKSQSTRSDGRPARVVLQKAVASRSSALRQVKLAEARTRNGNTTFPAAQVAAVKANSVPIITATNRWRRNRRTARRLGGSFPGSSGNLKVSVNNVIPKNMLKPLATAPQRRFSRNLGIVRPGQPQQRPDKMVLVYPTKRLRTLDSLFASLKEKRVRRLQRSLKGGQWGFNRKTN